MMRCIRRSWQQDMNQVRLSQTSASRLLHFFQVLDLNCLLFHTHLKWIFLGFKIVVIIKKKKIGHLVKSSRATRPDASLSTYEIFTCGEWAWQGRHKRQQSRMSNYILGPEGATTATGGRSRSQMQPAAAHRDR